MRASESNGRQHAELVLSMDARSAPTVPRLARTFVRSCAGLLDSEATETAVLLTSEAVTNSVLHTTTERVLVSLERIGGSLRIAVTDDDPALPVLRERDETRPGGLGILMIDAMASAWGVDHHETSGKRVWFEVETPRSPGA